MTIYVEFLVAVAVMAFLVGVLVGLGRREKPLKPIVPMIPYDVQKKKFEADQRALQDCMNYSIDVAYQTNGEDR